MIVYTGAIVVLFLFVIMLLGVDTDDDLADRAARRPAASWPSSPASPCSAPLAGRRSSPAGTRSSPAPTRPPPPSPTTCPTSPSSAGSCSPTTSSPSRSPPALLTDRRGRRRRAGPPAPTRSSRCPTPESMTDDGRYVDELDARASRADRRGRRPTDPSLEPYWYLILGALLFAIGAVGLLVPPQPARDVHVRRADAQRRQPHVRHLRARCSTTSAARSSCSSCSSWPRPRWSSASASSWPSCGAGPDATADDISVLRG